MHRLLLPLAFVALLPAQDPPPVPALPPQLPVQDPQPPQAELVDRPLTPEERVAKLEKERDKLKAELEAIRAIEQKGGLAALVRRRLAERGLVVATIKADPSAIAPSATPGPRGARLLGDAEKAAAGKDVLFTVDGLPVVQADLDGAVEFLRSAPHAESEDELKTRAILELVRLRAAQAAFADTAKNALQKIEQARAELAAGTDFAAVAQKHSDCPSKGNGGDLDYFTRDGMDFWFSRAAFGLKVGEVSGVVPSRYGYHVIKLTGRDQAGGADRVRASHILAMYGPDEARVKAVQMRVNDGKVDLAFASDDLRKLAPAQFR
jgi:parvulin-like peptidyl-prolyl isomerase